MRPAHRYALLFVTLLPAFILADDDRLIPDVNPYTYKQVDVLDSTMAYIDAGAGEPIVFLHGNPTVSYMWRNVIPYVEKFARCLAPDFVGYGHSGKSPAGKYTFHDHAAYLAAWMDKALPEDKVTFVGNDWGVQLSLNWAAENPDRVRGVVFMEGTIKPRSWDEFPEAVQQEIRYLRSNKGRQEAQRNTRPAQDWIEPSVGRKLTQRETRAYNRGFDSFDDRLPIVMFPSQIPLDGEPVDVNTSIAAFGDWAASSPVPKLFINVTRPVAITEKAAAFARTWPSLTEVKVEGGHYVPEENPHAVGQAIADWYQQHVLVNEVP